MQPNPIQEEDFGIDMDEEIQRPSDWESRSVDLDDYADSPEDEEATWWDLAKDVVVQPALGFAGAFTWGADVLKMGMVGEALTDLDELESAFQKAGKPFDRDKYIQTVAEQSQFIPTQDLAERLFSNATGVDLEPKTKTGKRINQFFTLVGLLRGKGVGKASKSAAVGTGLTTGLEAAGVNETAARIIGDLGAGAIDAFKKEPRVLSKEAAELEAIASKHGLPFPEYLTREADQLVYPKITDSRRIALDKNMAESSKQAIEKVIEGEIPASKLRQQGYDLEVLYTDAYDEVANEAKAYTKRISTQSIVNDIDAEIARVKKLAPSPSDADRAKINILEAEKKRLTKPPPKPTANPIVGPNGQPINPPSTARLPKEVSANELVQQIKNYNSNRKGIYKRPEFSGREEAVTEAYGFLNNSVRNAIEADAGPEIRKSMKAADSLFAESMKLDRSEGLISKAFKNGEYNPKKLDSLLNTREGGIVRRDLGDKAIQEIKDIARLGEKSVKATEQLAKQPAYSKVIGEWGPLAGYMLYRVPKGVPLLLGVKSVGDRVRGYMLTNPATREVYGNIVKKVANGSIKGVKADFDKLEEQISKQFGSVDEFMDAMKDELQFWNPEEE